MFYKYVNTGESIELADSAYLRIHEEEISDLMENYIKDFENYGNKKV